MAAALAGTSIAGAPAASAGQSETVIVTATGLLSPVTAVLRIGGTVLSQFHLINGVEAVIPTILEPVLDALPGITVTPDASVSVQSSTESTGPHTPSDAFLPQTGATQLAASGDTGQGVTVAVLDTGIDNLPDFSGRLAGGVDLTGGNDPFQDGYGHGTFVAGLIAGNGASSNGQYSGEAPGAKLVSIKVAGADGTTHLSTLILGLQWAVDHQQVYGIKVINVSLGYQTDQSTIANPLDQAVEATWSSGITVLTSAGNAGPFNGTILSPGDDPLVITVGALDDMAAASVPGDEMTNFSSIGPTNPDGWIKPDLVTSGRSVVSLAAPGSTIYNNNPSALIGTANFVGSGTSFSAAIASGAAALVLADNPGLTPNQVKARLLGNTDPGPAGNPFVDGHGALNALGAATAPPMNLKQGILSLAPTLLGITVSLLPTRAVNTWNTSLWSGVSWTQGPNSARWPGLAWDGNDWNGWTWTGRAWNDGDWAGATWNGDDWTGRAWNDDGWSGSAWNGAAWNGSAWNSSAWN
ncbi:MAG TPA: S8 family serine peptidase [Streptosporangiaceae bacterium]|nr:S8 family serine peptidase [Streptosporangiaceae bacterium]